MANTPESPFDRINRLLQQQSFLNDQQSQEMQTAITSAVEDFPNRLADAQSLLNQNVSSIMTDFGPKSQEITSQLNQLKLDPSQQLQFEQQLNAGLTQLKSQSGQLGNFKIPNISGTAGSGIDLFAGGTGELQNAISSANFGEFNQAISQGTAALGQSIESGQVQNVIASAAGQVSDQLSNFPDQFSQLSQSLQIPGEGNPALSFSGLNADELQRLSADAFTNLEDIVSGDQLGVLLGQGQQGAPEFQAFFDRMSLGSGDGAAAGKEQQEMSTQKVNVKDKVDFGSGENKLHDYESYTYRITLYMLTKDELSTAVTKPREFKPKHVLISSGGSYSDTDSEPARVEDFQEDFYFDDLDVQTVVGLNSRSKASNAIDINFSIVEPYGLTLLDRLMSATQTIGKANNYIEQPYLLEITFLGNPTGNNPNTFIDRKRIPIKIMEMQIKPGAGGSVYRCRAVPFNHIAFLNTIAAVPATISVVAGSVGEFFSNSDNDIQSVSKADVERAQVDLTAFLSNQSRGGNGFSAVAKEQKRQEFLKEYIETTKSFPSAYNTFNKSLSEKTNVSDTPTFKYPPTQIAFKIDEEISKSKIVREQDTESRTVAMNDLFSGSLRSTFNSGVLANGKTKQEFPVQQGTNIIQLIDRIIQKSDYIYNQVQSANLATEQLKDAKSTGDRRKIRKAEEKARDFKFLDWYKIIPQVELLEFDSSRSAYSKRITFHIKKYKTANAYHPDFKLTRIPKDKIVRSYEYLYTGNNKDIIDIDIDFDSTFYTQITAFHNNKPKSEGARFETRDAKLDSEQNKASDNQNGDLNRADDLPVTYQASGANADNAGQSNRQAEQKSTSVSDIAKSIYTTQRGDMLNVSLKIIGDPDLIKQDDIYIGPASNDYNSFVPGPDESPLNKTFGTVSFDSQQTYVQLLTRSAVDIDDTLGIVNKGLSSSGSKEVKLTNGRRLNSTFSGVYKILTVQNSFSKGQFTQTLDIIRMPNTLLESTELPNDSDSVTLSIPGITAQATGPFQQQASSLDRSDSGAQGLAGDIEEQVGVLQEEIERLAPAFASLPTSPVDLIDGQGIAEGLSIGQLPGLNNIIDLNRQQITATVDNITNTNFVEDIGINLANDIPNNTDNTG